ncbi:zinc finger protein 185 [Megalops cyprinoides]|uniref:zinc finger protein 185 n=1 Tax=Megalops cyprinoides TaxID=118141 RepID=UPI0018653441|nr:zinc finger protein 185 [Megalops cyprinoides]
MSAEGDRQSVFRTTKVRTTLKGDNSWINRRSEPNPEPEEKPWMAEVRATRMNGASTETSPVTSPTSPTPPSPAASRPRPASTGYLIRGVFTKMDTNKPPSPSTSNGVSGSPSAFTPKKPSDSYKRIAPHSVRPASESSAPAEPTLSPEEFDKRTEAASSILRGSATRQRSYVLSAAKKYETTEKSESPLSPSFKDTPSFIATRVVINDEDDSATTKAAKEVTPHVPTAQDKAPVSTQRSSGPAADMLTTLSNTLTSTTTSTSSPVKTQKTPEPKPPVQSSPVAEPTPEPSKDLGNDDLLALTESPEALVDPFPSSTDSPSQDLLTGSDSPLDHKTEGTLDELADDVIPIDTGVDSLSSDRSWRGASQLPTDEKLARTPSPEAPVDPLPSGTDFLSQDLLTGPESEAEQKTTSDDPSSTQSVTTSITKTSLIDTFDPIPKTKTETPKSSSDLISLLESDKPKTTEISAMDLLDSFPEETTKSSTEPLSPLSNGEVNASSKSREDSVSDDALDALADDVIPFNTDAKSLSTDELSESKLKDTPSTEQGHEEPEEEEEDDAEDDRQTITVTFERKSSENDSPWDRWTTPTINLQETETVEERETETKSTPPSSIESYETHSKALESASQEVSAPDSPESKKGFVYVKEYINSTELAKHNTTVGHDGGADYVSSSSTSYSYSSPSSISRGASSNCTYCGEHVGSEGKITIEDLNIYCHPGCFKCGVCSRPMGDLLYNMFLHGGVVHCESCYSNVL